jgi:hypothetical protein
VTRDDDNESGMSPEEAQRQAAAINHLLGEIGLTHEEQTTWWNLVAHHELGGRTATAAWLAGDTDGVRTLVEAWYAASTAAGRRAASNPEVLALLRRQLSELDDRAAHKGRVHRSA